MRTLVYAAFIIPNHHARTQKPPVDEMSGREDVLLPETNGRDVSERGTLRCVFPEKEKAGVGEYLI